MVAVTIDTTVSQLTADPQSSSPFFALLPAEVRNLIYDEFWNLSATRKHIIRDEISSDNRTPESASYVWSHVPCITHPSAKDSRLEETSLEEPAPGTNDVDIDTGGRRLRSEWCWHWPCGEQHERSLGVEAAGAGTKNGILNVLRTCKRMYMECLPSLYANTTFVFTDTVTAELFLDLCREDLERRPLRSLELCIRTTNIMTEIYYPAPVGPGGDEGPPAVFAGQARPGLSMQSNPWQRVCDSLAQLPSLQYLHIYFDSKDLRPWHKRVSETRFFGRLFDVRVPDKSRFVLALPELPARRGPDAQVLEGHYLEDDRLEKAPFTVVRGPRPNNFGIHLRNRIMAGLPAP